jgi:hypothetical protein
MYQRVWRKSAAMVIATTVLLLISACENGNPALISGFEPIHPRVTWGPTFKSPGKVFFAKVDSLQPEFRWMPFPGVTYEYEFVMRKSVPFVDVDPDMIQSARYDLRIWDVEKGHRGDLVYESKGIEDAVHKITTKLAPSTEYYWSVRARFDLEGQTRVSEWSLSEVPCVLSGTVCGRELARRTGRIQDIHYFRFRTPGAK